MPLYTEDICAFKADPSIIGTVEYTSNDVDTDISEGFVNCYIHKSLPSKVRKSWFQAEHLDPGYVIVAFMQPYDGYCLVAESSLQLVDRALAVGDVVKRGPSDAQSGTVISTSLMCTLQPLCSVAEYTKQFHIPAQGHSPSHGPHALNHRSRRGGYSYGFALDGLGPDLLLPELGSPNAPPALQVPAKELTFWNDFREEDHIIYRDWIGRVKSVYDEVTIRLTNGSVVTVEDPDQLEEPYYVPGTASHELAQLLDRAGFYQYSPKKHDSDLGKAQTCPAEPCYPGQHVQTKKGNLRCGRWKFGAYDPTVQPIGIVVDVRCLQLEVSWISPNVLTSGLEAPEPPLVLDTDILKLGEIRVYDYNKVPKRPLASTLSNASYAPDTSFGSRVRFRDPAGAAVKYADKPGNSKSPDPKPVFTRISRAATQGFDMNVLQIMSTATKALVRWQDCALTEEDSTQLIPYLNADEHDIWPGEKVSFKPEEEQLDRNHLDLIRSRKVGVVQSVDAFGRIALVTWYDDAQVDMIGPERTLQFSGSKFGKLGDLTAELSLYDIAAHPALETNRGDLALIRPEEGSGSESGPVSDFEWVGEIVDLCSDGEVIVRLGASFDLRDVKLPAERLLVVASWNSSSDSDYTDEEDYYSDFSESSAADSAQDTEEDLIDLDVEYEGGKKLELSDEEFDEDMWITDEEDNCGNDPHISIDPEVLELSSTARRSRADDAEDQSLSPAPPDNKIDRSITFSNFSSMPPQFCVLDESAPNDHHYIGISRPLMPTFMRRMNREHKILLSSLPDGVFVRTWANRLDLLRVLIVGPHDTPYELAPFIFDFQFGAHFPNAPPDAFFHSWTGNLGRINPNLYEDGKICLSLLGTWSSDKRNEEWSSANSTVLQIIVSLMGLVLVKEPYFSKSFQSWLLKPLILYDDLSAFGSSTAGWQLLACRQ